MNGSGYSDSEAELSEGGRYAVFALLDPSVSLTDIQRAVDKESPLCIINAVNKVVAQRVACSDEGLGLTRNLLGEFSQGRLFPERAALLGVLGKKAVEHMESAEYCLVFRDYRSMSVLIRAAFEAAAMMRYVSQNTSSMEEWIDLTAIPWERSTRGHLKRAREIENGAVQSHSSALLITDPWQRHMFNCMAHPNLWGLIATEEFAEGGADAPLTGTDATLSKKVRGLLERETVPPPKVKSEPSIERLRMWRAWASFLLSHVIQLYRTVTDVTGGSKDAKGVREGITWRARAKRLLA